MSYWNNRIICSANGGIPPIENKRSSQISKDAVKYLRKHKHAEGRISNLYLSSGVSQAIEDEAGYIKNKAFDDQYYKDLIVKYLKQYGKAKKKRYPKSLMG